MMLLLEPTAILPTVSTTKSPGFVSRDTIVCSRSTTCDASTTVSTLLCGIEPCAPFPWRVIRMLSPAESTGPVCVPDSARRECKHVLGERDIGLGNPIAQPIVHHRLGTAGNFFGRLKQRDERAAPRAARLREEFRGAEQTRHMRIMTTRVAHIDRSAILCGRSRRRVWQAGGFFHRKRVHVCPREHSAALSTTQNADDTCPADPFEDLVSELFEL